MSNSRLQFLFHGGRLPPWIGGVIMMPDRLANLAGSGKADACSAQGHAGGSQIGCVASQETDCTGAAHFTCEASVTSRGRGLGRFLRSQIVR